MGSIPGLGRSPGEGNGSPLQYPSLENPTDREAWWAIVHRVAKSWTRLKQLSTDNNKAERQRIDAFDLCCWRRLLRISWTTRRSNPSIIKEISSEYSLEGLMLKLKL